MLDKRGTHTLFHYQNNKKSNEKINIQDQIVKKDKTLNRRVSNEVKRVDIAITKVNGK